MDNERNSKENPLLFWLFIISGVCLIAFSFGLRAQDFQVAWMDILIDLLLNVGASLIATAGIAYVYQQFGTDNLSFHLGKLLNSVSITKKAVDLGIKDMWHERRDIHGKDWNTFTKAATSEVWLMGMAEHGFAEDSTFYNIVSAGTAKGCNYRFLLLDPDSDAARIVDERESKREVGPGKLQGLIRDSIQRFSEMQEKNKKKKGKVEIRVHAEMPQVSIVRSDDEFLITPYMYYRPGDESFTLLVHKTSTGISEHYVEFFNKMWERAYPPKVDSTK